MSEKRVKTLEAILVSIDSDLVELGRAEVRAIARHVVQSDWLAAHPPIDGVTAALYGTCREAYESAYLAARLERERAERAEAKLAEIEAERERSEAWLLSLRDEKRAQGRFANEQDHYPGAGDYDHGVAHGINLALGREGEDE